MTEPNGRATIREVYDLVAETRKDILAELDGLSERVSVLERWRSFLVGALAIITAGIGLASPYFLR